MNHVIGCATESNSLACKVLNNVPAVPSSVLNVMTAARSISPGALSIVTHTSTVVLSPLSPGSFATSVTFCSETDIPEKYRLMSWKIMQCHR